MLMRIAILALGYFIFGIAGLLLAVPPGYASPLFPSAGIALAVLLCGGSRLWPGIWLGSFGINVWTGWQTTGSLATMLVTAAAIGLGASLQAFVASTLVRRYTTHPLILDDDRDIARFLALGGPVGCLVSATVGVGILTTTGEIPATEAAFNWLSWWVGDSLGVVITAPILMAAILHRDRLWRRRLFSIALPTLAVALALIVTFLKIAHWEQNEIRNRIEIRATAMTDGLRHELAMHDELVAALRRVRPSARATFIVEEIAEVKRPCG